ncbi:amidohydrolase family protein [Pseudonocardia sp.]|uniref:amidohydrolase family protein n=1 Tax=Pseudonocardia sp. TaxID=60912 RepID=UPI002609CC8D|nr:amidohydrolase family protein [Pseudonocardia sp.]
MTSLLDESAVTPTPEAHDAAIIVSSDSHVSPRFEDLRDYCPAQYQDDLAEYMRTNQGDGSMQGESPGRRRRQELNGLTAGHYDMAVRLADMDADGVAAEVVFHGSFSRDPFPFHFVGLSGVAKTSQAARSAREFELNAVGIRLYNRWLAESCSQAPERLIGAGHLPMWEIEAATAELEWLAGVGIRTVNFPAMAPSDGPQYDSPAWTPFWRVCEESGIVLNTHAGAAVPGFSESLPHSLALAQLEQCGWPSRRGMQRMVIGGVFERHPGVRLMLTEQPGKWWSPTITDMDTAWMAGPPMMRGAVPQLPSYYMKRNVFVGASFMAHFEAEDALTEGYADNVVWGRDYPHREGTWAFSEDPAEPNRTHLALRDALAGLDLDVVRGMAGENGVRLFRLDRATLVDVANRIGAPTAAQLGTPLDGSELQVAERYRDHDIDYTSAFRRHGAWA